MGKVKQATNVRLRNYVSEFGSQILSTDGFILFCKVCEIKINFEKNEISSMDGFFTQVFSLRNVVNLI